MTGTTTAQAGSSGSETLQEMEAAEEVSPRPTNLNAPSTDRIPAVRSSRRLAVGAVALLGLVGLGFWALQSGNTPEPVEPVVVNTPDPARIEPSTNPAAVAARPLGPVAPRTAEPPKPPPEDATAVKVAQQAANPAQDTQPNAERAGMSQSGRLPSSRPNAGTLAQKKTGKLAIAIRGWAYIFVDGKPMGRVPPNNELDLPVGRHKLLLTNPGAEPYEASLDIKAGEPVMQNVVLTPLASPDSP